MKMKKATSWLLSIAMILSMLPATAFAAEADDLCEHHAEHTAECGYVEGVSDCAYHCDVCLGHDHGDEVTEEDTEPAPVCDCGTDDAAIHATTCAVYEAPENPVCFCAEKCFDTNIWCDVCGFDYTACGGSDTAALYEDTTYPYAVVDTEAGTVTIDGTLGGKTEAEESDITALLEAIKGYVDSGITTIIVTGSNAAMIEVGSFIMPAVSEALYRLTNETSDSPYCGTIDLILPNVTEIVDSEFDNTFALNSITLHKVTTVGDGAFYATKYLKKLTFGSVITFVNEKSRGPFHMDGYEVGGCDLVLNCGQLQAEEKYKPNLETNVWFIGDWSGEYEWKSITLNHTEGTAATCNAQATCSVCGDSYGEVDADAHSYGDWVSNGDGTHTRTCANDSNHTENGDCSGGTATCTEQAVCDICKTAYGALGGHTPAEDATYTDNSDGTHSYTCSSCGNLVTESHTFTDGACTGCGVIGGYCGEEGNEQNVIWTYANGTLTISGTGAIADQRDNYDNRPWEEYVDQITTIVVNDGITSIGEAAFWRFQKLTTAKLPDSLTTISQQAFYGCTALKTVNFPANLKTIEGWAFLGCALESVTLPEGLTTIGYRAFSECKTLTSVTVPASVTTIDEGAFGYSPAKITVAEDNLNYSSDEHGVLFDKDKTTLIYCRPNIEVETYTIPSTVTEICKEAFYGCKNLATITIPDGVQKIGSSAFGGCEALTTITIPAGVTTIEANTFYDCTALTAVTIPAGVTTIDMWAFSGCTALTTVTIPASVTSIAYNAFSNCSALTTVNVPCTWDGSLYTFDEGVTVNKVHNWTNGTCTVCGEPCDHKDSTHTTATNNGNGTHSFTCTVCLTTFTENHTMDDATGLCDSGCGKMMAEASVTKSVAGGIIGSGATTYYETLGEAIQTVSNCTAGDYATVKLLSNLMLTETITISSGVFTLDLNEKNVVFSETATIGFEISGGKVTFAGNGTVTKEDGTVTVVNTDAVVTISGGIYDGAVALANAGTVTVSGGTLKGSGFGIRNTGDLTIAGGEVSPYQKNTSNPYNVTAIISSGGRITVTGGTLKEGRFGMIMYQDGTIDLVGFREAKDVTIWRDDLSTVEMNASDVMLPEGFGLFDESGTQQTGSIAEGTMLTVKQLHVHDWTYTADGNTITATCNAEGCSDAEQSIMISAVGKTYDGTPVTATLDGSIDGVTVSANDITYSGNTNADTYTASITIEGKTASVKFTIEKAKVTVTANAKSKTYGAENPELTYTASGLVGNDTLAGALATTATKTSNVGEYDITVGSLANRNYTIKFVGAKLTITKATAPAIAWPTASSLVYGQTLSASKLTSNDSNGTFAWQDGNTVPTVTNNGYVVVYTPKDTDNYDYSSVELTKTISVTVSKVSATVTAAPTPQKLTYTGQAQNLINAGEATGGTMQYSIDNQSWSTTIPQGMDSGTYTVYYKVVGDVNHSDTAVDSVEVTIAKADPVIGTVGCEMALFDSTDVSKVVLTRTYMTVEGTLELTDSKLTAGEKTYNWKFTPADGKNYNAITGTVELTVTADVLETIVATGKLEKDNYSYGDTFSVDGLTITATYTSGATKDVTALVEYNKTLSVGQTSVELTYQGKICTVTGITVAKTQIVISGMSWTVPTNAVYSGTAYTATLNGTLPEGVTVTKNGDKATNAGDYTAKAVFSLADGYSADNYEIVNGADLTAAWSIAKKDIAGADVVLGDTLTYTGSEQTQTVTKVEIDGLNVTYTVSGNAGTNVGNYTLTVTGTGNYTGSVTKEWSIGKAAAVIATAPTENDLTYTGNAQNLITGGISNDGKVVYSLTKDGQYTETSPTGTNAGEYTVWYYVVGDANHSDSAKASVEVTIAKAKAVINVDTTPISVTYGEEVTLPTATTNFGEVDCDKTADDLKNAGTYTVTYTVEGTDNYEGDTKTLTVKIGYIVVAEPTVSGTYIYTGSELTVVLTGFERCMTVVSGNKATNAGNYEVVVELSANYKWADGSDGKVQWSIGKAQAEITVNTAPITVTYGETVVLPEATTNFGTVACDKTADDLVNVGTYAVTYSVADTENFDGDSKTVTVTVNKADGTVTVPTAKTGLIYTGSALELITAGSSTTGTMQYKLDNGTYGTEIPKATDVGTYTIYYKVVGDANHNDIAEQSFTVPIAKAKAEITVDTTPITATYGETVALPEATTTFGDVSCDMVAADLVNVGTYTVTYFVAGTDNYNGDTKTVSVTIAAKAITAGEVELNGTLTYNGKEQTQAVSVKDNITYTVTGDKVTDAGSYELTVTGTGNYTSEVKLPYTVGKKPISVVWENTNLVFNGSAQKPAAKLAGAVTGDDVQVVVNGSGKNAGTYDATVSLSGTDAGNYTLTGSTKFTIARAPVTFKVSNNSVEEGKSISVAVTSVPANVAHSVTYRQNGSEVTPSAVGEYEIYVEITDGNYRHAASSNGDAIKVGVLTIYEGKKPVTHTLSYTPGEGTGTMAAEAAALAGTIHILPECTFIAPKDGNNNDMLFVGWTDGTVTYKAGEKFTQPEKNVVLTAVWVTEEHNISGMVKQFVSLDGTELVNRGGVVITLMLGSKQVAQAVTDESGNYKFEHCLLGVYNLVAEYEGIKQTAKAVLGHSVMSDLEIDLPAAKTNTTVSVEPGTPDVVVGGLDGMLKETDGTVFTAEDKQIVESGGEVEIKMDVKENPAPEKKDELESKAGEVSSVTEIGLFLNLDLTKTVTKADESTGTSTAITKASKLLENIIFLPGHMQGKNVYHVFREHGGQIEELPELTTVPTGTTEGFILDRVNHTITIYSMKYSTYAIAYTNPFTITFDANGGKVDVESMQTGTDGTLDSLPTPTRSSYTFKGWFTAESGGTEVTTDTVFKVDTTVYAQWNQNYSGGGGGYVPVSYTITAEDAINGTVKVDKSRATCGSTVTLTVTPDIGYTLETLTVTTSSGKEIDLTNKGDGKYTFKMPSSKVTVKATFMDDNTMLNFFVDVSADAYYHDAVLWAAMNGITNGTSATTFSPDNPCTRAQMATFLWRAAGSPEPVSSTNPFADIPADAYYAKAVQWAYEKGITGGTSGTTFSPDQTCTRGQMATFLWRNAGSQTPVSNANQFADVPADKYYATAVQWAYEQKITSGTSSTTFSPDDPCTRAQMVTFLYRFFVG